MRYMISLLLASTGLPALAEVPRVVTDMPPVHALVSQVMGDLGAPVLLLDKGADAHAFQLRPSQARALAEADLVVWIGPEMTPWLDRALDGLAEGAPRLGLLAAEGTLRRAYAESADEAHDAEGHDDEEHEAEGHDAEGHEEDDHGHGGIDPHAWLDPGNAMLWLRLIGEELSRQDPANAAAYSANAARAAAEIAALDSAIAARLAPFHDRPFVVFHDAYGYFIDHFGLGAARAVALGDAATPGAARIAAFRDDISAAGAICLFPEVQHDPALLEQLAEGTTARIGAPLDPEGAGLAPGPAAYAAILNGLSDNLATCLGG